MILSNIAQCYNIVKYMTSAARRISWINISDMQICELLGTWLSDYRIDHGLTLSQIADAARKYGANWRATNIARMEAGGNSIDALPTLLILFAALNDLTGDNLKLSTPFTMEMQAAKEGMVDPYLALNDDYLADLYDVHLSLLDNPVGLTCISALTTGGVDKKRPRYCFAGYDHGTPVFDAMAAHYPPTSAERRLAIRLSKKHEDLAANDLAVAAVCDVLYGHSLDEEAAKRAGEGATPQKRGRVTRVLAGEILDYMRKVATKLEK